MLRLNLNPMDYFSICSPEGADGYASEVLLVPVDSEDYSDATIFFATDESKIQPEDWFEVTKVDDKILRHRPYADPRNYDLTAPQMVVSLTEGVSLYSRVAGAPMLHFGVLDAVTSPGEPFRPYRTAMELPAIEAAVFFPKDLDESDRLILKNQD